MPGSPGQRGAGYTEVIMLPGWASVNDAGLSHLGLQSFKLRISALACWSINNPDLTGLQLGVQQLEQITPADSVDQHRAPFDWPPLYSPTEPLTAEKLTFVVQFFAFRGGAILLTRNHSFRFKKAWISFFDLCGRTDLGLPKKPDGIPPREQGPCQEPPYDRQVRITCVPSAGLAVPAPRSQGCALKFGIGAAFRMHEYVKQGLCLVWITHQCGIRRR